MEPVIMELERKETVVVVGHQAVLRFLVLTPHPLPPNRHTHHPYWHQAILRLKTNFTLSLYLLLGASWAICLK